MANKRGTFHVYERRGKGSTWRMIDQARTQEDAKKMAENMVRSTSYPGQQARVKDAETGNWIRNSLVTKEIKGGAS